MENQTAHRIKIEEKVIDANIRAQERGQWMAYSIGFAAIIGGILLLFFDKPLAGYSVLVGAVATLVGVFVYGKGRQRKELKHTKQELENTQNQE